MQMRRQSRNRFMKHCRIQQTWYAFFILRLLRPDRREQSSGYRQSFLCFYISAVRTCPNVTATMGCKRMPGYVATSKDSARQKLEAKIAAHKLTTRGHFKELDQDLKDERLRFGVADGAG
jgi:hypothetical protein